MSTIKAFKWNPATSEQANLQRMLNTAVRGVIRQGKQAVDSNSDVYQYRTASGDACAVGWLIPDNIARDLKGAVYVDQCFDAGTSSYIVRVSIGVPDEYAGTCIGMLSSLQSAHDGFCKDDGDFIAYFRTLAEKVAKSYGLRMPTNRKPRGQVKPGPTKRYAAHILRKAADMLEANPEKHISGRLYRNATSEQCAGFCALGACDIVYSEETGRPRAEYTSDALGSDALKASPLFTYVEQGYGTFTTHGALHRFNDNVLHDDVNGKKRVISAMRTKAYMLEHGGKMRPARKAKAKAQVTA